MPVASWCKSRYMPPKLHCIQPAGWNEGLLSSHWICLEKGVVSFFIEVDTRKELASTSLFHVWKWAWHKTKNYAHSHWFIFNEVDTVKGTFLEMLISTNYLYNLSLFHFLASLTQDKELCSKISHALSIMMQIKVHAPQVSLHSTSWIKWRFTFKSLNLTWKGSCFIFWG